jgi:hypothetical protein
MWLLFFFCNLIFFLEKIYGVWVLFWKISSLKSNKFAYEYAKGKISGRQNQVKNLQNESTCIFFKCRASGKTNIACYPYIIYDIVFDGFLIEMFTLIPF